MYIDNIDYQMISAIMHTQPVFLSPHMEIPFYHTTQNPLNNHQNQIPQHFDVVIDKIAYCSNDIRYVMDYVDCDKYIYMSRLPHVLVLKAY